MRVNDSKGNDLKVRDIVTLWDDKSETEYSIVDINGDEVTLMDKQGRTIKDLATCLIRVNQRVEKACSNCRHWIKICKRDPNSEGLVGKGICAMTASFRNRPINGNSHGTTAFAYQAVNHLSDKEKERVFEKDSYLFTEPEHYCSMHDPSRFRDVKK